LLSAAIIIRKEVHASFTQAEQWWGANKFYSTGLFTKIINRITKQQKNI